MKLSLRSAGYTFGPPLPPESWTRHELSAKSLRVGCAWLRGQYTYGSSPAACLPLCLGKHLRAFPHIPVLSGTKVAGGVSAKVGAHRGPITVQRLPRVLLHPRSVTNAGSHPAARGSQELPCALISSGYEQDQSWAQV